MQKRPELRPESRKKTLAEKILDSGKINFPIPDKKGSLLQEYILKETTINPLSKL